MSQRTTQSTDVITQVREMLGLGREASPLSSLRLDDLLRTTRRRLLDCARALGLSGLSRLTKDAIAQRLQNALQAVIRTLPEPPRTLEASSEASGDPRSDTHSDTAEVSADASHKFDLGLPPPQEPAVRHIPWGYGQNRVTAMVVDPDRLFVYWEVTDDAVEEGRASLGAGGAGAWLNLRVYDVTGRIFDGTNAHSYFDHKVDREQRHWFFEIGKPTSTTCVEVGLRSTEGYFVRIARSGRADFPASHPSPPGDVEWLTVRTPAGPWEHHAVYHGPAPRPGARPGAGAGGPGGPGGGEGAPGREPSPPPWEVEWVAGKGEGERWERAERLISAEHMFEGHWDWREMWRREWGEHGGMIEWTGPAMRTSWESGPFTFPIESPLYVEERHGGSTMVYRRDGRTQIVYGPWQVVIRGLGAHAERRVLAVWEVHRAWVASAGYEVETQGPAPARVAIGGSERLPIGASERRWLAASELRLGGASEVFRLGASEVRFLGASETAFVGASERRMVGASERRLVGASEWRVGGASEWRVGGASEWRYVGASEQQLGGASEWRYVGASERRLGGASEGLFPGASERRLGGASEGLFPDAGELRVPKKKDEKDEEESQDDLRLG